MFDKSTKCNTDAINSSSSSLSVVCIYNSRLLLIWLTVSSRKDLSIAPCFMGHKSCVFTADETSDVCYQSKVANHS